MVFLSCFVQVDKKNGVYFPNRYLDLIFAFTFVLSSKADIGSAGEQPIRN
jgi:hypothetical protein